MPEGLDPRPPVHYSLNKQQHVDKSQERSLSTGMSQAKERSPAMEMEQVEESLVSFDLDTVNDLDIPIVTRVSMECMH